MSVNGTITASQRADLKQSINQSINGSTCQSRQLSSLILAMSARRSYFPSINRLHFIRPAQSQHLTDVRFGSGIVGRKMTHSRPTIDGE